MTPSDALAMVQSEGARAVLRATGGQLWRPELRLPDGRWRRPLAEAPWGEGATGRRAEGLPGHLADLGGEFLCLPFGGNAAIGEPAPGWEAAAAGGGPDPMHGPAANAPWHLLSASGAEAAIALDLPERGLRLRRILRAEGAALTIAAEIESDRAQRLPVAFHPNLALPARPGALALAVAFAAGRTYPARWPHAAGLFAPGARFGSLAAVPKLGGGTADLSRLPPGPPCDDVVLLLGARPPLVARWLDEGWSLRVDWDGLPHLMLWVHDRGLAEPPWGGRFRALGVEPMAAAFDLPEPVSVGPNPLAAEGWATALDLAPGVTRLRLRLEAA
jgi:galactose mutarotase-like enzyme